MRKHILALLLAGSLTLSAGCVQQLLAQRDAAPDAFLTAPNEPRR